MSFVSIRQLLTLSEGKGEAFLYPSKPRIMSHCLLRVHFFSSQCEENLQIFKITYSIFLRNIAKLLLIFLWAFGWFFLCTGHVALPVGACFDSILYCSALQPWAQVLQLLGSQSLQAFFLRRMKSERTCARATSVEIAL